MPQDEAPPSRRLLPGDPAPWFTERASNGNAEYQLASAAGRTIVLCFFGSAASPACRRVLDEVLAQRQRFDDDTVSFFGVSVDQADETQARVRQQIPGIRYFWDFDRRVSRLYSAVRDDAPLEGAELRYHPFMLVLDPLLRIIAEIPFDHPRGAAQALFELLDGLPPVACYPGIETHAPVLILPRVFERVFCAELIELFEHAGGYDSGFMREVDGRTVGIVDYRHKRRSDHQIADAGVRRAAQARIERRLVPELRKAFQFAATRMERYIVACYDAETGGYFRPHRDNSTRGTAHRCFAVTINLNAEDYEGGDLRFPEFGPRTYRAPTGGAVVFSCSLLHEALPVRAGRRYAFLPFLYDEAAAALRERNAPYLRDGSSYRAGSLPRSAGDPGDDGDRMPDAAADEVTPGA